MMQCVAAVALLAAGALARGQQGKTNAVPTVTSAMESQLEAVESQFVPAAEAMPAERYGFAPGGANFAEVRTFALEVRHVATANFVIYSAMLGQEPPAGVTVAGAANGPEELQTKEQIVKYLKDSFALGHKAFAAMTAENDVDVLTKTPIAKMNTRLALATFSCLHAMDHYGQMVEYLRMNGVVPPASQGQAPANPKK